MSSLLRIRQLYPSLALNERRLADFTVTTGSGTAFKFTKAGRRSWRQSVQRR